MKQQGFTRLLLFTENGERFTIPLSLLQRHPPLFKPPNIFLSLSLFLSTHHPAHPQPSSIYPYTTSLSIYTSNILSSTLPCSHMEATSVTERTLFTENDSPCHFHFTTENDSLCHCHFTTENDSPCHCHFSSVTLHYLNHPTSSSLFLSTHHTFYPLQSSLPTQHPYSYILNIVYPLLYTILSQ